MPLGLVPCVRGGHSAWIELLVVIAIIAVWIALVLPVVQAAREVARRSQYISKRNWDAIVPRILPGGTTRNHGMLTMPDPNPTQAVRG